MTTATTTNCERGFPSPIAAWEAVAATVGGHFVNEWPYGDGFRVARFEFPAGGKTFRPIHLVGDRWELGDPQGPLPLYRVGELPPETILFVVEGESCADCLWGLGLPATTSAHGALSPAKTDWTPLAGRQVVILSDNDSAGQRYTETVVRTVTNVSPPASVKIVKLPGLPDGGDVVDWVGPDGFMGCKGDGEIKAEILRLAAEAPNWTPSPRRRAQTAAPSELDKRASLLTDLGNSYRFVHAVGHDFRWWGERGCWLTWRGRRWERDTQAKTLGAAKRVVWGLVTEAQREGNDARRTALVNHAMRSQKRERLTAMIDLARPDLAISADDLDSDPMLLNCLNGTVDLTTGQLAPHFREDYLTKLAPTAYDPAAKCPLWERFLSRVLADDGELIDYVRRVVGYCLTGNIDEQYLFVAVGPGANGKSVFLTTICGLLGDYAGEAAPDLLIHRRNAAHPTELADLAGLRLVVSSESGEGGRLRTERVKRLTGDERIKARWMRSDFFTFTRTHKTILCTNHLPRVDDSSHAMWRRIRVLPFHVTIPPGEQDRALTRKLSAERAGILNWALRGCLDWQHDGLQAPDAVEAATEDYKADSDRLAEFLAARCDLHADAWVTRTRLFSDYQSWATEAGEKYPLDRRGLYERVRAIPGVTEAWRKPAGGAERCFEGIGLVGG